MKNPSCCDLDAYITTSDIHPFCITKQCSDAWCDGMNRGGQRSVLVDGCFGNDCLCVCFPCAFAADIIACVPFLAIFGVKKCAKCVKPDAPPAVVTKQPYPVVFTYND